ncbi:MAG: lysophospholipid acyltransferase family protein [Ferruginibacter sp.]
MEEIRSIRKSKRNQGEFLKDIFGRIWAVWAFVLFIITFLIIFIPSMLSYLFKDQIKGQTYFIGVSRWWMRFWLFLIGCPLKVSGREHFKKGQAYVIVYNHNALLDVPLSAPFVPGPNKTIAKASFAKVPIFGWFYKRGSVLVDRKDNRSRIKSFEEMRNVLRQGMHMCIYPEGTRNRTDQPLKEFFDGAFKIAVDVKKDVIPCIIFGTKEAIPISKGFYLLPTRLRMDFLPAVSSEGCKAGELKDKVFEIMKDHYINGQKYNGRP